MRSPRWKKVGSDLWSNMTRTALVVLSIAVGVFSVGMIAGSQEMMRRDMQSANAAINQASATFGLAEPFSADLADTIRRVSGVGDADVLHSAVVQVQVGPNEWKNVQVRVLPDYRVQRIDVVTPLSGAWPPPRKALLAERSTLGFLQTREGATVTVRVADGSERRMPVAGTLHDLNWASDIFSFGLVYVSRNTAEWLGLRDYNRLRIVVAEKRADIAHIREVVGRVRDKLERGGLTVAYVTLPDPPGKHWADSVMQALMLIMTALGVVSTFMSGFLVVNTIGALLTQQTRQIGVMKAIGAGSGAIARMYLVLVTAFGLLSLLVAVPLGALGAHMFVGVFAGLLNFDARTSLPLNVLGLELAVGLLVPLLAALWPILAGTRITVREAIGSYGVGKGRFGAGHLDRLLARVRFLSRPLALALRNTFRRRGRLALTLSTLVLGGAMLIAVLSVRESLLGTLDDFFATYSYDIELYLERSYRVARLDAAAAQLPGVARVESWGEASGRRIRPDGSRADDMRIDAPPTDTALLRPTILEGRWLVPGDQNALVITTELLKDERDLKVGDTLLLDMGGREVEWHVVGVAQVLFTATRAFAPYDYTMRVTGQTGRANVMKIVTDAHDAETRAAVAGALRDHFKASGIRVQGTRTVNEIRQQVEFQFSIIVMMLLVMALLLAVVGGLGLAGMMSINVLERTREIGVLRAIGAADRAIHRIVVAEGVTIGVTSWAIAAALALPFSSILVGAVGEVLIRAPMRMIFSLSGMVLWLAIVTAVAAVASLAPAQRAARITVRDALAYE